MGDVHRFQGRLLPYTSKNLQSSKYLRFHIQGQYYQFKPLPFGFSTAPMEFSGTGGSKRQMPCKGSHYTHSAMYMLYRSLQMPQEKAGCSGCPLRRCQSKKTWSLPESKLHIKKRVQRPMFKQDGTHSNTHCRCVNKK